MMDRAADLLAFSLADGPTIPALPAGYRFVDLDAATVPCCAAMDEPRMVDHLGDLIAAGERGVVVCRGDEAVHRSLFRPGPGLAPVWYSEVFWDLGPGEALIHYCETRADQRGRGLYPAALGHLVRLARDEFGVHRVYIFTDAANRASLAGIRRAGFAPLAGCRYVPGCPVVWEVRDQWP